ncbi:MAG: glycerate kinase [Acidimicrobiia bacterium]|nr:glycerate kinase [Acidimicrobiia bacterium]MYC46587.1 glycerate kinase [Acidimicrobiia bacterium]
MASRTPRLIAAPDKFKGTASAAEIAAAACRAAEAAGWEAEPLPMADGGEGTLATLGGANRHTVVTNPLGDPVNAGWRLDGEVAVIEMAEASGLQLVGGAAGNDALAASTYGTGELIEAALERDARRIIVCVGGSATTDGGFGALRALLPGHRLRGVELVVACDVRTRFCDAAEVFAPQKGATPAEVKLLRRRLARLVDMYAAEYGVDVADLPGAGAAGGLAGGLAALGARLVEGFEVVAEETGLAERLEGADLVVTGEGLLDAESFNGKVVGGVCGLAERLGVPALAMAGAVAGDAAAPADVPVLSLSERFGPDRAFAEPTACVEQLLAEHLSG